MIAVAQLEWRRAWLAIGWFMVGILVFLSLAPLPAQPLPGVGDKVEHVLAYAGLMLWFSQLYESTSERAVLCTAFFLLGAGLECAQALTPYRTSSFADAAANGIGIMLGWIAAAPRGFRWLARFESFARRA